MMFKLKTPCLTCPFKKGMGSLFRLPPKRLDEIFTADAFQCHKTLDTSVEDGESRAGKHPQQCAGWMSLLHKEDAHSIIMSAAMAFDYLDPETLNKDKVYDSFEDARKAHRGEEP